MSFCHNDGRLCYHLDVIKHGVRQQVRSWTWSLSSINGQPLRLLWVEPAEVSREGGLLEESRPFFFLSSSSSSSWRVVGDHWRSFMSLTAGWCRHGSSSSMTWFRCFVTWCFYPLLIRWLLASLRRFCRPWPRPQMSMTVRRSCDHRLEVLHSATVAS